MTRRALRQASAPPRPPEAVLEAARLPSVAEIAADPIAYPGPAYDEVRVAWAALSPELQRLAEPLAAILGETMGGMGFWGRLPSGSQRAFIYSIVAALALAQTHADEAERRL